MLFLLNLVPPPSPPSTHCPWPEGNSAPSESITEQVLPQISLELSSPWAGIISQRPDPSGDNRSNLSFVAAHLLAQTSSVLKQGEIFPLEDKKEKLPLIALFLAVAATFDSGEVRCPFPGSDSHRTHTGSTLVAIPAFPPMLLPLGGVLLFTQSWISGQGLRGMEVPSAPSALLICHVRAPGQLSKVPPALIMDSRSHTSEEGPFPRDITGHSPVTWFLVSTLPALLCAPQRRVSGALPAPRLHGRGTFTHTDCAEQSSTVPSPSTSQSPHSNLFLLQFKVLWHFIWKIL